ncbi:MAG: nucleotide exchange factor GrpE [Actinobacteria bacterium]|nr:nucleotide exchange factor GrpE [Actinomycetota bacterium]
MEEHTHHDAPADPEVPAGTEVPEAADETTREAIDDTAARASAAETIAADSTDSSDDSGGSVDQAQNVADPLAAITAERDEYLADLQRVQAEFDNFRKRVMREGTAQRTAGVAEVVTKLLDVLDDFDMAVLSVDKTDDVASLHKGLELVYSKLIATIRSLGVVRVDDTGVPFDPERHEAVASVEAAGEPHDEPLVVDVLRPGYLLGERVLRAAMVKVEK